MMDQPKFTKEETRSALWEMIDDKSADYWLDAFEAAVLAEALQPREPSPDLAEAIERLKSENARACEADTTRLGIALLDELSRLRANEKRLEGLLQEYAYAHHNFEEQDGSDASAELLGAAEEALLASAAPPAESAKLIARPLSEWHEGKGSVLWWRFPAVEPPYSGSPLDDDFPDYVTHWTPIVVPDEPAESAEGTVKP